MNEEETKMVESSGSSKESSVYNYGKEGDDDGEEGDISDESDHFMDDRQTDEDYSAYRERIFDWSPRKGKTLVEELELNGADAEVQKNNEDDSAVKEQGIITAESTSETKNEIVECVNGVQEMFTSTADLESSTADEKHTESLADTAKEDQQCEHLLQENERSLEEMTTEKRVEAEQIENDTKETKCGTVPRIDQDEGLQENNQSTAVAKINEINTEQNTNETELKEDDEESRCFLDWRKLREKYFSSSDSSSDESEDISDAPYYKILDVAEETACYDETEGESSVAKKNKRLFQSIKKNLTDIKELMDWNFTPNSLSGNKIILKPWDTKDDGNDEEEGENAEDSDAFKLMESALKKQEKPEFEVKEPEVVISETDVIRYAKNIKDSINTIKQNETVRRVLTTSKNMTVMEMQEDTIIEQDDCENVDSEPENSVMAVKGISEIRTRMAEFRENLDAFTNKYKQQYSALINKYNEDCDKYDRCVRAMMKKEVETERMQQEQKCNQEAPLVKVQVTEEEFMKQMENMVGEENFNFLKANEAQDDGEVERLRQACLSSTNYFENEREKIVAAGETRNITRTLEMQLAEED